MDENFEHLYQQGRRLFEEGRFDRAEPIFKNLIEQSPKRFADVYNKLGIIFHQRGEWERASLFFKKALEINPKYTEASLNLAVTYNDLGRYEDANEIFGKAAQVVKSEPVPIDPFIQGKLANEHALLGDQYYDLSRYDEALDEYRKALNLRPTFVDIITKIGVTLREKGQFDEAIRVLMRAKELNPNYSQALIHLGVTYYMKGFIDLAMEEWGKVQDINPESREAKVYLSLAKRETV
ncbi:MAG TPA: tetratricopeptide repeat protein [Nitrospiria bacterium]|jgi:tetratricopeptide (TPR) repeat protein